MKQRILTAILMSLSGLSWVAAEEPKAAATTVETLQIEGKPLTLKVPAEAATGKPWLWVGEFGGHLQSLEEGLVAKGWHVAYLNFPDQFGSEAAMKVWEKAYDELIATRGLAKRPAMLGISRGGLYVNAWTRLHPERVSVLYLDNAVCDIRSWPGGFPLKAQGAGSPRDWELYKQAFGYKSDQEAMDRSLHPTDGLDGAIKDDVLLLSVHGTADRVVPHVDNSQVVIDFWTASKGRVKVLEKPGGDHHPHGLPDPAPLIELLTDEAKRN